MKNKEMTIVEKIKLQSHKATRSVKKHSPALLLTAGIVGFGATVYLAYKARPEVEKVVSRVENDKELGVEVDTREVAKDLSKALALPLITGALSTLSIIASYKIQYNRILGLSSALAAAQHINEKFQENYITKHGEDEYKEFLTETEQEVTDDEGNVTVEKIRNDMDKSFGMWYEDSEFYFADDHTYNIAFIDSCIQSLDLKLFAKGNILLNEVLDKLGLPRTRSGALLGWSTSEYFNIEKIVYNQKNPVTGEIVPQIFLKWTTPKYVYDDIDYDNTTY